MMDRTLAIRVLALYGPAMLAVLPWALHSPPKRRVTGALLATAWNIPAVLFVNVLALRFRWWTFSPTDASLVGMPVDLLIGWALLWGAAPALLLSRVPLWLTIVALAVIDLVLMPLTAPVVVLGDAWLVGEAFAILVALVPAQLFARCTGENRNVELRACLQAITFSALILWVLPSVIFELASGDWSALARNWNRYGGLPLQLALFPGLMGIAAVQEFAMRGRGTPLPFDPPPRLVTSGPYAYVANPMQLSVALVLVGWGVLLQSFWIAFAGGMSVIYSAGLAKSDEQSDLGERFGEPWRAYRRYVNAWIPRWRPYHTTESPHARANPARLYVAASCPECSDVGRWFLARGPRGLDIVAAEEHPTRALTRITYDPCDGGGDESGVAAIGRALEHIHLGWAMVGWFIRLPVLVSVLQLIVDASGGAARATTPRVTRMSA